RQQILRFSKERIAGSFHPVERQTRLVVAEPNGHFAADQVYVMSAQRENLSQLGRDDAAPTNRCVADDADIHDGHFISVGLRIGSRTTMPSAQRTPASAPNCASRLSINCRNNGVLSR